MEKEGKDPKEAEVKEKEEKEEVKASQSRTIDPSKSRTSRRR